ncbi:MAG: ABC transporter transmembrane domain-containing protein [Clostridia bacterium]
MHYMKQYLKPYWKQFLIGPVFKLLEAILELFMPIMMARIINEGVLQQDTDFILQQGGLMALIAAIGMGSAWICQYSASVASQGFGTRLRSDMFKKSTRSASRRLNPLEPARHHSSHQRYQSASAGGGDGHPVGHPSALCLHRKQSPP